MHDAVGISDLINQDPEIMSGTPVFRGTRVPVSILFEWIEGGETLDFFLENFPSVSREQAVAVLESHKAWLLSAAK